MSSKTTVCGPSSERRGASPPAYPKARIPAARAACTPYELSSTTAQPAGVTPMRLAACRKRSGGRLAVRHLARAEDPAREAVVEPGEPQRVANLLVSSARRDTRRDRDGVERLENPGYRRELGGEGLSIQMSEWLFPARRKRPTQVRLDLSGHFLVALTHESLDHFRLGHRPAELGEHGDVDQHGDALGVHQYAVAIEDHE